MMVNGKPEFIQPCCFSVNILWSSLFSPLYHSPSSIRMHLYLRSAFNRSCITQLSIPLKLQSKSRSIPDTTNTVHRLMTFNSNTSTSLTRQDDVKLHSLSTLNTKSLTVQSSIQSYNYDIKDFHMPMNCSLKIYAEDIRTFSEEVPKVSPNSSANDLRSLWSTSAS